MIFANSATADAEGGGAWVPFLPEDNEDSVYNESDDEDGGLLWGWAYPMAQFKQYHGLTMQLYNDEGLKTSPAFEHYVTRLQKVLVGPIIGPQKGPNFVDNGTYADIVGRY
jgi:hypothetical protein